MKLNLFPKAHLRANLKAVEDSKEPYFVFQVLELSHDVEAFLSRHGSYHDVKTGFTVKLGRNPEIADSLNTIYLPYGDSENFSKLDVTRFPTFGKMQLNNRAKLVEDTLTSLVETVVEEKAKAKVFHGLTNATVFIVQ